MFQTMDRSSTKGYNLYFLGSNWELHSPTGIFTGNLKSVCTYAVNVLGFQFKELDLAVNEMEKQFHNAAEFGIYKSFIFTFERGERSDEGTKIH